jgi:hypothetical protein
MVQLLLLLIFEGVGALLLGAGWASFVSLPFTSGLNGFIFRSWIFSLVIFSVTWAWIFPLNLGINWATVLITALSGLGWIIAYKRKAFAGVFHGPKQLVQLLLPLLITLIAALPACASVTQLSVAQRIGPDAIGSAASASLITKGVTASDLEKQIVTETGGRPIASAFIASSNTNIHSIASATYQYSGEFLIGAGRWAYAGTAAILLKVFGLNYVWQSLSSLAAFSMLVALLGIWLIVLQFSKRRIIGFLAILLVGLNCSLLYAWHEGGLGEIWSLPGFLLLCIPFIDFNNYSKVKTLLCPALGVMLILPSYSNGIYPYAIFYAVMFFLTLFFSKKNWKSAWSSIVTGLFLGSLGVFFSSKLLVKTVSSFVSATKQAGWPVPQSPDPASILGIVNYFNVSSTSQILNLGRFTLPIATFLGELLLLLVAMLSLKHLLKTNGVVMLGAVGTLLIIYFSNRVSNPTNNYEYWKAVSMLVPVTVMSFVLTSSEVIPADMPGGESLDIAKSPKGKLMKCLLTILGICVFASSVTFLFNFRSTGSTAALTSANLSESSDAKIAFQRFNVVTVNGLSGNGYFINDIAPFVNLNWVGRGGASPIALFKDRISNPVAVLISESNCLNFRCIESLSKYVIYKDYGIALVQIANSSIELSHVGPSLLNTWAYTKFAKLH